MPINVFVGTIVATVETTGDTIGMVFLALYFFVVGFSLCYVRVQLGIGAIISIFCVTYFSNVTSGVNDLQGDHGGVDTTGRSTRRGEYGGVANTKGTTTLNKFFCRFQYSFFAFFVYRGVVTGSTTLCYTHCSGNFSTSQRRRFYHQLGFLFTNRRNGLHGVQDGGVHRNTGFFGTLRRLQNMDFVGNTIVHRGKVGGRRHLQNFRFVCRVGRVFVLLFIRGRTNWGTIGAHTRLFPLRYGLEGGVNWVNTYGVVVTYLVYRGANGGKVCPCAR